MFYGGLLHFPKQNLVWFPVFQRKTSKNIPWIYFVHPLIPLITMFDRMVTGSVHIVNRYV